MLKFGLKKPNMKTSDPKLDPRLQGIKELVERPPTTELYSHVTTTCARASQLARNAIHSIKEQGLAKLNK